MPMSKADTEAAAAYPLCAQLYPLLDGASLSDDTRSKYRRTLRQLCKELAGDENFPDAASLLSKDAVLALCSNGREKSIPYTARAVQSLINMLANPRGPQDKRELSAEEQQRLAALESLAIDEQSKIDAAKLRAPPLAAFISRIESAPLTASIDASFVSILRRGDAEQLELLDSLPYDRLVDWVLLVVRAYCIPARARMFTEAVWGATDGHATCTFQMRGNAQLEISVGLQGVRSQKNGFKMDLRTDDDNLLRLKQHGLVDPDLACRAVWQLWRRDSVAMQRGTGLVFSRDAGGAHGMTPKERPGNFFHRVTGARVELFRRSFEQAAQDLLRDTAHDFSHEDDALVHALCQHTPSAAAKDYRAAGVEQMDMPECAYRPDGAEDAASDTPPPSDEEDPPGGDPGPDDGPPGDAEDAASDTGMLPLPSDGEDESGDPPGDDPGPDDGPPGDGGGDPEPDDRLDAQMRAIADGGTSDLLLAQACAELYTAKRCRGEGQDLELAREGLLALGRLKRARIIGAA